MLSCHTFSSSQVLHLSLLRIIALARLCLNVRIIVPVLMICGGTVYITQQSIQQEFTMQKIEIYSKTVCPYCVRAKHLFTKKGVNYTEIDISQDSDLRDSMIKRANGRQTVPQIFINDQHIGGCDDLYALEAAGKLDALLKGTAHA